MLLALYVVPIAFEPLYLFSIGFYNIPVDTDAQTEDFYWETVDTLHYLRLLLAPGRHTLKYTCPHALAAQAELDVTAPGVYAYVLCKSSTVAYVKQAQIVLSMDSSCGDMLGAQQYGKICLISLISEDCQSGLEPLAVSLERGVSYDVVYRIDTPITGIVYYSAPTLQIDTQSYDLPAFAATGRVDVRIGVIADDSFTEELSIGGNKRVAYVDIRAFTAIAFAGYSSSNYAYFKLPNFAAAYQICFQKLVLYFERIRLFVPISTNTLHMYNTIGNKFEAHLPDGVSIVQLTKDADAYELDYMFSPYLQACQRESRGLWVWFNSEGIWLDNGLKTCDIMDFDCDVTSLC